MVKKILFCVLAAILLIVFAVYLCLPLYANYRKAKLVDNAVSGWIKENISSAECLTYSVRVSAYRIHSGEDTYNQKSVFDLYNVTLNHTPDGNVTAQIVHANSDTYFADGSSHVMTQINKAYYILATDKGLYLYTPTENGYTLELFENEGLSRAVADALCFADIDYLFKGTATGARYTADKSKFVRYENFMHSVTYGSVFYNYYDVSRGITPGGIFEFAAKAQNKPIEKSKGFAYIMMADPNEAYAAQRLSIELRNMDSSFICAYEAVTGKAYTNIFTEHGDSFYIELEVSFPNLFDADVPIELPEKVSAN